MGMSGARSSRERAPVGGLGVLGSSLLREQIAEVAVGANVQGIETDRLTERRFGRHGTALPVERDAETPVERGMLGPDGQRLAVHGLGLGVTSLAPEPERQVRACPHVRRCEREGLTQRGFRLGVLALAAQGYTELVMHARIVRTPLERASKSRLGAAVIPQRPQGTTVR